MLQAGQRLLVDLNDASFGSDPFNSNEDLIGERTTNEPIGVDLGTRRGRRRRRRVSVALLLQIPASDLIQTDVVDVSTTTSDYTTSDLPQARSRTRFFAGEQVSMWCDDEDEAGELEAPVHVREGHLNGGAEERYLDIVLWSRVLRWMQEQCWLARSIEYLLLPASNIATLVKYGAVSLLMRTSSEGRQRRRSLGGGGGDGQVWTAVEEEECCGGREVARKKAREALHWTKVIAWVSFIAQVTLFVSYASDERVVLRLSGILSGQVEEDSKAKEFLAAAKANGVVSEPIRQIRQASSGFGDERSAKQMWTAHLFLIVALFDLLLGRVRWRMHAKPAIKSATTKTTTPATECCSSPERQMGDGSRLLHWSALLLLNLQVAVAALSLEHLFEISFVGLYMSGALEHASPFVELLHLSNQMALNLIRLARVRAMQIGSSARISDDEHPSTGNRRNDGRGCSGAVTCRLAKQTSRLIAEASDRLAGAFQRSLDSMRKLSLLGQLMGVEVTAFALLLRLDRSNDYYVNHQQQTKQEPRQKLTDSVLLCACLAVCFAAVYRYHNKYHAHFVAEQHTEQRMDPNEWDGTKRARQ